MLRRQRKKKDIDATEKGESEGEESEEDDDENESETTEREEMEGEEETTGEGGMVEEDEEGRQEEQAQETGQGREVRTEVQERGVSRASIPELREGDNIKAMKKDTGEEKEFEILSRAGKKKSKRWSDSYNVEEKETGQKYWVDLREYDNVRRCTEEEEVLLVCEPGEVELAKMKEFQSWRDNEVYEEVRDEGQRSVSVRWVVTNKEKEGKVVCKARLVARGFEEEEGMKTEAPTCAAETMRLGLTVILYKGWESMSLDVKTAYLQGDKMVREVYVKPPKEAKTKNLWKLKKTIYGLKDAARAWYDRVVAVFKEIGGERSSLEPTLFVWKREEELIGLICIHVDDFILGGNQEFHTGVMVRLKKILRVGEVQCKRFCYLGVNVEQTNNELLLEQENYVKNFKVPEEGKYKGMSRLDEKEMKIYRGLVGKMNWVAQQSRPDMAFEVSMGGMHFSSASGEDMLRLIKMVKKMKKSVGRLRFERLKKGIFWEVHTDASYGNIGEELSQIGYTIALKDELGSICPIQWKSVRAKRVARTVTEAEALALTEGAEWAMYLNEILKETIGKGLRIVIRTDSQTLEKALKSATGVKNRRLRIDLAAVREMISRKEIEVDWIEDKEQVADVLTKEIASKRKIKEYMFGKKENGNWGED